MATTTSSTTRSNITDKIISQCVNLFNTPENQSKLKITIIDPLVAYFQRKLRLFYVVIIILVCLVLVSLVFLAYQVATLRSIVLGLGLTLPVQTT